LGFLAASFSLLSVTVRNSHDGDSWRLVMKMPQQFTSRRTFFVGFDLARFFDKSLDCSLSGL
jgi:hypothetical protein